MFYGLFRIDMGVNCPVLHSISVQTATSDTDLSMVSVWEKSVLNNKVPTFLVSFTCFIYYEIFKQFLN